MKYALLIYGSDEEWESRSDEERAEIYKEYFALSEETGVNVNTLLSRKRYAVLQLRRRLQDIYDDFKET